MEWYSGTIPGAIQSSKMKGSVFIVYISGDNDDTKQMDIFWTDPVVAQLCKQESAVAVKIMANSEECSFFSQIYPVVIVPAAFFIGNDGMPLEVVGGQVLLEVFREKVKKVLESYRLNRSADAPLCQTQVVAESLPKSSTDTASASPSILKAEETESSEKKQKMDLETRLEKAKEFLEQKKAEKLQKEAEERRQKEIERRKLGQNVQQLKQYQQEREIQEVREQLKKEKEEERKARERVKQQIEKDRADRNARFLKEKAVKEEEFEESRKAKLLQQQQDAAEAEARRCETARIQFRMPNGSSVSQQFSSSETLQTAYDFISQAFAGFDHTCMSFTLAISAPSAGMHFGGAVTLSTTFPRRTFTVGDMASTFLDLQLAPTAVIIVVPNIGALQKKIVQGGGGLVSLLLTPLMFVWNFFISFFTTSPTGSHNSNSSASRSLSSTSAAGGDRRSTATKRSPGANNFSRQDGSNIRRLRNADDDDDDDENATWNGNSTQQM